MLALQIAYAQGVFTDNRDGKRYKYVLIGTQIWMAENLNYEASGSECYNKLDDNCSIFGRLYNWAAAMTACPADWHLPGDAEWSKLINFVDGTDGEETRSSLAAGKYLKAKSGWNSDGNGLDDYGFAAMPGGEGYSNGYFGYIGYYSYWWSASEASAKSAYYRSMSYGNGHAAWHVHDKPFLHSVRCVKFLQEPLE